MTTRRANLLKSILANPDDDHVRLVFSDWLEEQGELDRAEFIRVQCEIFKWRMAGVPAVYNPECTAEDFDELRRREIELLEKHDLEWAGEVLADTMWQANSTWVPSFDWDWDRGFVNIILCSAADFLAHADAILREHPVQRVKLTTWPEFFRHLDWNNTSGCFVEDLQKLFPTIEFELPERHMGIDPAAPEGDYTAVWTPEE